MPQRPLPTAIRRANGNPGKRAWNHDEPVPPDAQPRCPGHLSALAQKEWRRLANTLHKMGVLTTVDRAALAAYCAAYGRWAEAEEKLKENPSLYKTPSGYVQQSPWLGIANKQLELMGRFMVELGMTPAARSRVAAILPPTLDPLVAAQLAILSASLVRWEIASRSCCATSALRRAEKGAVALRAAVVANADRHAHDLAPEMADIRAGGATSLRAMAAELNDRGMLTRRGGRWHVSTVMNLLDRLGPREVPCANRG